MNKSFYKNSTKTAIGGIIAALSIVLMLLTSAIPTLTYAIPAIAGLLLVVIVIEVNKKWAFGENEKSRVTWEGIAVWIALGHTFKELKGQGALMTGSAYPGMWDVSYEPGDLESMAEAYSRTYINCCLEQRGAVLEKVVRDGKCDGLIMHQNRSCKNMSLLNNEGGQRIQKNLGVPYVIFDGDQTDARNFSEAQFDTRVEALAEMMADKKANEGGNH